MPSDEPSPEEKKLRTSIVQRIPEGPVDVVGDVHGEYGALLALLDRLGYDFNGNHPDGRRLIFVGDLIDRGPDSVAVVRYVRRLIDFGRAQCVLGNHELNAMLGKRRHGNHWFFGETESMIRDGSRVSLQVLATEEVRKEILDFFASLPVALERDDLRVVHATWDDTAIDRLRDFDNHRDAYAKCWSEAKASAATVDDDDEKELILQNQNPINLVLSGVEEKAAKRFYAGGCWRTLQRARWWETYPEDSCLVVFGHYWRRTSNTVEGHERLFDDTLPFAPLRKNVMCIDYSIGKRYEERAAAVQDGSFGTALAALRLPEGDIFLDNGRACERIFGR